MGTWLTIMLLDRLGDRPLKDATFLLMVQSENANEFHVGKCAALRTSRQVTAALDPNEIGVARGRHDQQKANGTNQRPSVEPNALNRRINKLHRFLPVTVLKMFIHV